MLDQLKAECDNDASKIDKVRLIDWVIDWYIGDSRQIGLNVRRIRRAGGELCENATGDGG